MKRRYLCVIATVVAMVMLVSPCAALAETHPFSYLSSYYNDDEELFDGTYTVDYSDELFSGGSYAYNGALATAALSFAMAGFNSAVGQDEDYSQKDKNIKALLKATGFSSIATNEWYTKKPSTDSMGVAIGKKNLGDSTLIALVCRGGGYEKEWAGNVSIGTAVQHQGFRAAADIATSFLKSYIETNKLSGKLKLFITGFSRGAATANMTAALIDDGTFALPEAVSLSKDNLYAYTFETPANARLIGTKLSNIYNNIFNIVNPIDLVPKVAPSDWKYSRYGKTLYTPSAQTSADYAKLLKVANAEFKKITSKDSAGEIDGQAQFITKVITIISGMLVSPQYYTENYQAKLRNVFIGMNTWYMPTALLVVYMLPQIIGILPNVIEYAATFAKFAFNGGTIIGAHYPELCLAWLRTSGTAGLSEGMMRQVTVRGAESVEVRDGAGVLLAQYSNLLSRSLADSHLTIDEDMDGELEVFLPLDGEYVVNYTASAEASALLVIERGQEAYSAERVVCFENIAPSDEELQITLPAVLAGDSANYQLEYASGSPLSPEVSVFELTDAPLCFEIAATATPAGEVVGSGVRCVGERATVTALKTRNYSFLGWYENGELVCEQAEYSFIVDADRALEARYELAANDGWQRIDGGWYYGSDGAFLTGEQTLSGYKRGGGLQENEYLFDAEGRLITGFVNTADGWVYYGETGYSPMLSTKGQKIKAWYVKNAGYRSATEVKRDYYWFFDEAGAMYTGWHNDALTRGKWMYFGELGSSPATSRLGRQFRYGVQQAIGNGGVEQTYFFTQTGTMFTGANSAGYFNPEGQNPATDMLGAKLAAPPQS